MRMSNNNKNKKKGEKATMKKRKTKQTKNVGFAECMRQLKVEKADLIWRSHEQYDFLLGFYCAILKRRDRCLEEYK